MHTTYIATDLQRSVRVERGFGGKMLDVRVESEVSLRYLHALQRMRTMVKAKAVTEPGTYALRL